MQNETETIEYDTKTHKEKNRNNSHKNGTTFNGIRTQVIAPIPACERIDRMFGSGGEAIIHYMWFEQGFKLFEQMTQNSPEKTKENILRDLVDVQPITGWGVTTATIIRQVPPTVKMVVQDPPVKTLKGSQKHLIGSFWTGAFTKYFDKQLICKEFEYDPEKDEFSCLITTSN